MVNVAVIGAGVAGLRAADVLLGHGANVTVFEARDHVGGRVTQATINNRNVDLGANFIHGTTDENPIYQLAQRIDASLWSPSGATLSYDRDGSLLPESLIDEVGEKQSSIMGEAYDYSAASTASIAANANVWNDWFLPKANAAFTNDTQVDIKKRLLIAAGESGGGDLGDPLTAISLKFLWMQSGIEGADGFLADSYRSILELIAKPALDSAEVLYSHRVSKITNIAKGEGQSSVEVQASNGYKGEFDSVVIAVPLGVLKVELNDLFSPSLPPNIISSIDTLGYGDLEKVYLSFPEAFWDNNSTEGKLVSADWYAPEYSLATNPENMSYSALNLASLPDKASQPTLLFYLFDKSAQGVSELIQSTPSANLTAALSDWFEPYYSLLPGYDAANAACKPNEALATTWLTDELAGFGAYTNCRAGAEHCDRDQEALAHGLPERSLFFAGEHTADSRGLQTVHGAYWSGERAAKQVLEQAGIRVE